MSSRCKDFAHWNAAKAQLVIGALVLLAGCAPETRLDPSSTAVAVAGALPPPDTPLAEAQVAPYRIGPGDELEVTVFGASDLDRTAVVDSAGNFSMPLAGALNAAGKTPQDFAREVEQRLKGPYLKNPQVAVNVKQATNQQMVTVDGEVAQPGLYPVTGPMTLQQAIATAKGATDTANIRNVIVFRTVGGRKMAAMFDLKAVRSGQIPDPQVYGNDIVVVGESATQKFLKNAPWLGLSALGRFLPIP
ncbi:MAG: polysaccharide biosynthesis/export family protein [Bacillota bacterium]